MAETSRSVAGNAVGDDYFVGHAATFHAGKAVPGNGWGVDHGAFSMANPARRGPTKNGAAGHDHGGDHERVFSWRVVLMGAAGGGIFFGGGIPMVRGAGPLLRGRRGY